MNSQYLSQAQSRSTNLTVDTYHAQLKYIDDDDLDEKPMDAGAIDSGLELSPPMVGSRRDSFAMGPSLFSPQPVDMQSVPSTSGFEPQGPNPFANMGHSNQFMVGNMSWNFGSHGPADAAHMQRFDGAQHDFNGFQGGLSTQIPFTAAPMVPTLSSGTANPSMPSSPQGNWVGHANNKRSRVADDAASSHGDFRRGDGIRKKNARLDIPSERNLGNIDHLIARSTDPAEIKELKSQKRLLRNRQAALDSRQRKKMHTERLEDEKKTYTVMIGQLEQQLSDLMADLDAQRQSFMLEREEMIRAHTVETGELRKQNAILKEQMQRVDETRAPTSIAPTSDFANPFETGIGNGWATNDFLHEYVDEPEQDSKPEVAQLKHSQGAPVSTDKTSPPSGFLFMLFLVGAFVLSSRKPQSIPAVSDDMRMASASLLQSVLKDAGVPSDTSNIQHAAPQPSTIASWSDHATNEAAPSSLFARDASPSALLDLGDALTQPTQDQVREHIFSLSAAQYDGITNQDFIPDVPTKTPSEGRRNLADALATMRLTNKHNEAAEVYTRTLLWDQIPRDVVRDFAKMVGTSQSWGRAGNAGV